MGKKAFLLTVLSLSLQAMAAKNSMNADLRSALHDCDVTYQQIRAELGLSSQGNSASDSAELASDSNTFQIKLISQKNRPLAEAVKK